jgi:hypothetical protein
MNGMSRRPFMALFLLSCIALGCNQVAPPKPTKQITVIDTSARPGSLATQPTATQSVNEPPGLIARMSYMRPVDDGSALKPFDEWTEQDAAVDALGRIGAAAVPQLVNALHSGDPAVRLRAIEVLGRMGEGAQGAVPDLIKVLNDPDADVRKAAARTLGRIGPAAQSAVPALMQKLYEPTPQ